MKFTLKACLFLVASFFATTVVNGLPQQDTKDNGSKTEPKKPTTKKPGKGTIDPIEQGGTAEKTASRLAASPAEQHAQPAARAEAKAASSAAETKAAARVPTTKGTASSEKAAAKKSDKKKASKVADAPPK